MPSGSLDVHLVMLVSGLGTHVAKSLVEATAVESTYLTDVGE